MTSAGDRKVVTILFADLSGSTEMQERLDAEATARVMERVQRVFAVSVETHDGRVVKSTGDGVMAVFGVPVVREDDAVRAVRAGIEMQSAFQGLALDAVALRVGINTGEVVVVPGSDDVVGDPVNVAARLEGAAAVGEVLVGPETTRLVRDVIPLEPVEPLLLKGKAEPVPAARVVGGATSGSGPATSFVGRGEDLASLVDAFEAAERDRVVKLITIVGWPGLGKSRLASEFVARVVDRARVIEVRFVEGGGSSFGPIASALSAVLEDSDLDLGGDRDRAAATISALVRGGNAGSTEQVFWATRRVLQAAASKRPIVVLLDDVHWAEPAMLDLIEHLVEWLSGVAVLLLALARPEVRDLRPALVEAGGPASEVRVLSGLDAEASRALALEVLEADDVPEEAVLRVLDESEGNPLFLRELLRLLVDDGVLQRSPHAERSWVLTVELDAIQLPATVHAALAARIEQLSADERAVLQAASVIGRHFERGAVAALVPPSVAADLDRHLASLHRRALVDPERTWWRDERLFRFHHVLIRDAAYRRVLKEVRAEQHVCYADWLSERVGDEIAEHDEVLAYHLEQAIGYRRDLGENPGAALTHRAVAHLRDAGLRALARDDVANAAALLGRARQLSPDDAELLRAWCEAVVSTGDVHAATTAVGELALVARDDGERAVADVYDAQLTGQRTPERLREVVARASTAAAVLATSGDDIGTAHAEAVHASALAGLGQVGAAEAALDRSLAAARRAGDIRRANIVLSLAPAAAVWGPSPIARASGRCLDVVRVLRITSWAPHVEAHALRHQAILEAMRQRADAARQMIANARQTFTDLGHRSGLLEVAMCEGLVELLDGRPSSAEGPLRTAVAGFDALGARTNAARATALLARALLELDRIDEAGDIADPLLAGEDLKAKIGLLGVAAEVLARRGDLAEGEGLARGAVALAEVTDALIDHADARLALARVLEVGARYAESAAEMARAHNLYEAKGATACMSRTQGEAEPSLPTQVALVPPVDRRGPRRRRVKRNSAVENVEAWHEAMQRGDHDAARAVMSPERVYANHRLDHQEQQGGLDDALAARVSEPGVTVDQEVLASIGARHVLVRRVWRFPATREVGFVETDNVAVIRVDAAGLVTRIDTFDGNKDLWAPLACLLERCAEDELGGRGADRVRAVARTCSAATAYAAADWDAVGQAFAEGAMLIVHLTGGAGEMRGREQVLEYFRGLRESYHGGELLARDVLAFEVDVALLEVSLRGRAGADCFDFLGLAVLRSNAVGEADRVEIFPPELVGEAWGCFDRLREGATPVPSRRVRPNLATAAYEHWGRSAASGDPAARASLDSPVYVRYDHALRAVLPGRRDDLVSQGFRIREAAFEPLASLGERHGLCRMRLLWVDASGDEVEFRRLAVTTVDRNGLVLRDDLFDVDRLPEALSCLIDRWAEGELTGVARTRGHNLARTCLAPRLQDAQDWKAYAEVYGPNCILIDRRPAGTKVIGGPDEVVDWLAALVDVTDELHNDIVDVVALSPDAFLWRWRAWGVSTGGEFELPSLIVGKADAAGWMEKVEIYSPDDLVAALARFDEFDCADSSERRGVVRTNSASDLAKRWTSAFNRRALDEANALRSTSYERVDHFWHHVVDRATAVSLDEVTSVDGRADVECLVVLGDRHCLHRLRFIVGEAVTERYFLTRTDTSGTLIERDELFGPDALAEALSAVIRRWAEGELAGRDRSRAEQMARFWSFGELVATQDWEAYRDLLADDSVLVDHRSNEEFVGADQGTAWIRELAAIASSIRIRPTDVLAMTPGGALIENVVTGEADGGSFDRSSYLVVRFEGDGRCSRGEFFPLERLDDAWEYFERCEGDWPSPQSSLPADPCPAPTKATNAAQRWAVALEDGDLKTITATLADDIRYDDRRSITGGLFDGRDVVAEVALSVAQAARLRSVTTTPLATAGDNVALAPVSVRFGTDATVDVELLAVFAVDDDERIVHLTVFDSMARDAAYDELDCLAQRAIPAASRDAVAASVEVTAAYNSGDLDRLRRAFTAEARIVDHRPVGWGDLDVESYITGVATLRQQSPDARMRVVEWLHMGRNCVALRLQVSGTSDGAAFQSPILSLRWCDGDRVSRIELHDIAATESVLATLGR